MATRITGLATGLDVDSIVKTTMKAYQTKIDQQIQKKDVLEIQQKQARELVKKLMISLTNTLIDQARIHC